MCGIAGIFTTNKTDLSKKINKGLKIIDHRGPDKTQFSITNQFAGGTCRLAIEALNEGTQPFEDDTFIAGFNGEIFNYKDLINKFNLSREKCNSEIKTLVALFVKLDIEFVNYLNGQFAIFIYNKKKKNYS